MSEIDFPIDLPMKPTPRMYFFISLFMGLFGALVFYLWAKSEGRDIPLSTFLLWALIFGIGGFLQLWLTVKMDKRQQASSKKSTT